jgi:CPA2 family monovalent cation:H+ antiporter-2
VGTTLPLLINLSAALAAAFVCGLIATALRLSPIVGYLVAGIAVGPFTPGFVADHDMIAALADIGIVLLMFALGIAFSLRDLARVGRVAIGGTLLQVTLTIAGGWVAGRLFGLVGAEALYLGAILVASSSMVILKSLLDRGEIASSHGRLLLSMSIVQDLVVVVLVAVLPQVIAVETAAGDPLAIARVAGTKLAVAAVFIGAGTYAGLRYVPRIMDFVTRRQSPELFSALTALLALGIAAFSAAIGLSAALGAFMAGLMLSESEYDKRLTSEIVPFRDLTTMLFFVFVGMMVDVEYLLSHAGAVLGFALVVIVLKSLATLAGLLPFSLEARTLAFTSVGMVPIGELNYLLANAGLPVGAISDATYNLVLGASVISILVTPAAFHAGPFAARVLQRVPVLRRRFADVTVYADAATVSSDAVVIGYGRVGDTVARGLHALGMTVTAVDHRLNLVRDATSRGLRGVYGDATARIVLEAAHVSTARLVVVAVPDMTTARAALKIVRELNPRATVIARARGETDLGTLLQAGADSTLVPEIAGAEALLQTSLDRLAMPS